MDSQELCRVGQVFRIASTHKSELMEKLDRIVSID